MELEGFVRCVDQVEEEKEIDSVATDRHAMIKKRMRTSYSHIKHRFDPWHVAKGISKKLTKLSKKKGMSIVGEWIPNIVNHLYWSVDTANGNGEELVERFLSVIHYIANRHSFIDNR